MIRLAALLIALSSILTVTTAVAQIHTGNLTLTSQAEVNAFDKLMKGTDGAAIMVAVRGLKASYQTAEGSDPNLLDGDGGGEGPTGGRYESQAEMTADMKDPRYKKDPAFRKRF